MNEETKRAFLTILRTGLKRFLIESHPFVGCVPAKNGKKSTHTFEEDLREVLSGSEIFIISNPTISTLIAVALEVIDLNVSTKMAVECAACGMSTKEKLPKKDSILLGLFYEYIVLPVKETQKLAVQNLIKVHPQLRPEERIIMRRGGNIAQFFDILLSKWWRHIVVPHQLGIAQDSVFEKVIKNDAFSACDQILKNAIQGISDLIVSSGAVNIDFASLRAVMENAGQALFGMGIATGKRIIERAVAEAIHSPLLDFSFHGAGGALMNVANGGDLSLGELKKASQLISAHLCKEAELVFGTSIDKSLKSGQVRITVIATKVSQQPLS